ncbi:hypothetical protein [Tabrizicola sp.]|uniref:hypothetical protein n=1 Tax=Tabrizicola sp. TaxID=2005166 RepID=UPI003F404179
MTARQEILPTLDPIAFAGALLLAPLLVAALFFWVLLVPVFAVPFGAVPYLVFGTPVLLWIVTRYPLNLGTFAMGGFLAYVLFILCFAIWQFAQPDRNREMLELYALFGIPFSAAWCAAFARIYRSFHQPVTRSPGQSGQASERTKS